jgi:hypothetical protein
MADYWNDRMAWATKVLWPQLPDSVRIWAVPAGDEDAKCRAKRLAMWADWLAANEWAREILAREDTKAATVADAKKYEREAFRTACRAAGLTGPMSQAKRANLLGIWRRTGRIEA